MFGKDKFQKGFLEGMKFTVGEILEQWHNPDRQELKAVNQTQFLLNLENFITSFKSNHCDTTFLDKMYRKFKNKEK